MSAGRGAGGGRGREAAERCNAEVLTKITCSIKKPKTSRYPSLKGTDPKFRRNHRHALHGTMKALVRTTSPRESIPFDVCCNGC